MRAIKIDKIPLDITFKGELTNLEEDIKKDITEKVETKITEMLNYEDFLIEISKNPKGIANILITYNDKTILEGRYQGHPISAALISWLETPPPGIR